MIKQKTKTPFWRTHLGIISFTIFAVGLAVILLDQQTSLLSIGPVALFVAHLVAFGGALLFAGGWLARQLRNRNNEAQGVDHASSF